MDLNDKISTFPKTPGVYFMKDIDGNVIYVGKSKKLQERIKSYFINSSTRSRKIERMIKNIYDIDIVKTDTELDALLLECEMIKKIRPMYNTLMRNPENYVYLKINKEVKYPYIEVSKEVDNEGIYFGAYTLGKKLEDIKEIFNEVYQIRGCKKMTKCFKYDLKKCCGPCRDTMSKEDYDKLIDKLIHDLENDGEFIINELQTQMKVEIDNLNFEKASQIKQNIDKVKSLYNKQNIIKSSYESENIIAWIKLNEEKYKVYIFRKGLLVYSEYISCISFDSMNKEEYYYLCINKIDDNMKEYKVGGFVHKSQIDYVNIIYSYIKHNKDINYNIIK